MRLFLLITIWSCLALSRPIELSASNSVVFTGQVNAKTVHTTMFALFAMRTYVPIDRPVYLILESSGGYIKEGFIFADYIRMIPNLHLVCVECSSMAGAIFQASPGKRYVTKNSYFLAHHSKPNRSDKLNEMFYSRIGLPKEQYLKKIQGRDWILKGEKIVKNRAADELVEIKCDEHIRNTELFDCEK